MKKSHLEMGSRRGLEGKIGRRSWGSPVKVWGRRGGPLAVARCRLALGLAAYHNVVKGAWA